MSVPSYFEHAEGLSKARPPASDVVELDGYLVLEGEAAEQSILRHFSRDFSFDPRHFISQEPSRAIVAKGNPESCRREPHTRVSRMVRSTQEPVVKGLTRSNPHPRPNAHPPLRMPERAVGFLFPEASMKPLKAGSQCSRLLAHLVRGRTVTSLEAFHRFRVTSLHRRLAELRDRGHQIDHGEFITRNGVKLKRYRLAH